MEDEWSGSETPSLRADEEPKTYEITMAAFSCKLNQKDERLPFLQSGYLSRLLSLSEEKVFDDGETTLYFFERPFVDKSLYILSERNILFKYTRCWIFRLMRLASNGMHDTSHDDTSIPKFRKEITRVFYFCNNIINRCKLLEPSEEIEDISNDFGTLSDSVGTISELVNIYSLSKINKDIVIHALFHIHLELNVHYILLLSQLALKYPDVIGNQTKFTQISTRIVHDLISLSNHIYERINNKRKSIWSEDFHLCSCLKEVWVTLIHTVDDISKKFSLQSFWSIVSTGLQNNNDNADISQVDAPSASQDKFKYPVEFKVCFLCHIAPLYWIDRSGNNTFNEKSTIPRNWQVMQELIQTTFSDSVVGDATVQSILWSCICLTKHWDTHLNIFSLIWNYFNKHMNTPRIGDTQSLDTYVKTVYSLSAKYNSCTTYLNEISSVNEVDNTFSLFLHYFVVTVNRLKVKNEVQLLSQIKGRVYSKFHKRSMNELNSTGLERFTTLFTVVALAFDVDEIPKKMCSLISLLQFNQQLMDIRKVIVENTFLCLLICKTKRIPAEGVVDKLLALFTNLTTLLLETKKKKGLYLQSWDILCYYFECVEQCFDYNVLIPEEGLLICSAYSELLKIIPDNQKKRIYLHFQCILSSSYLQQATLPDNIYNLVWQYIYIPLSEITVVESNSIHMAQLFAAITILSLGRISSEENEHFEMLIDKYGFANGISNPFKCLYISHIVSSSPALQKIIELQKSNNIIKLWISSMVQDLYKSESSILELTRSVLSLPDLLMWSTRKECKQVEHAATILIEYILHLGKTYTSMQTINQMADFRKKVTFYFSDFMRIAENIIFTGSCEKSVAFVFQVAGQLVHSCAKSIYSKTSPLCLLPKILDLFVLPLTSTKKPLSSLVTKTLIAHIHMFLSGLATLDSKADSFLSRKIKEIIQKYFLQKCSQETKRNPFLISLNGSCVESPTKAASDYRHLVLEYVRERFLILPQPPEQLINVLNFLFELVQNTQSIDENDHTMKLLFTKVVSCILVCDAVGEKSEPREVRKLAVNILRRMVSQTTSDQSRESLRALLHKFISDNLGYYQCILLKTMRCVCLISPLVVNSLLPDIKVLITDQEKKRGVGVDGALRESLEALQTFVNTMKSNI